MSTDFPSTVSDIIIGLQEKRFSSVELTQALLARIHEQDATFNSFITVCDDYALNAAKRADELRERGQATQLTGVPYANKDIF